MNVKIRNIEIISGLVLLALVISLVLYTFLYLPGITNYDVKLGFRFGFIDFFINSKSKLIVGIVGFFLIVVFSAYWSWHTIKHKYVTLGPIYFALFFFSLIFLNGYNNVVYRFDGVKIFVILIMLNLLLLTVVAFISSYYQLKKKYN